MEFHFFPLFSLLQETASDDAGGLHRSPPGGSRRLGPGVPGEIGQEKEKAGQVVPGAPLNTPTPRHSSEKKSLRLRPPLLRVDRRGSLQRQATVLGSEFSSAKSRLRLPPNPSLVVAMKLQDSLSFVLFIYRKNNIPCFAGLERVGGQGRLELQN